MVLGTMVCSSLVLGGDANTGSAGYGCFETELLDGESDFHAAMPAAFAFAALMGWPSCSAVDSPAVLAALSGGMLCYAVLSGFLRRLRALAAMLFWAALSVGYGGYACCVEYSLEFLWEAATLSEMVQLVFLALVGRFAPFAAENTRLFILLEMVQVVLCAENWVLGSFSQEVEADLFAWVEVENYEPEPPCTTINNNTHVFDLAGEAQEGLVRA